MIEKKRAPHLLDEPPILVYPSLADALGINTAIVFQQLHFLLNNQKTAKNMYNFIDGRWWVYNSYSEWKENYFSWLSESTLKGIFIELENRGLILSRQGVKSKSDRRKWYTIDYEAWDKFCLTIGQKMSDGDETKNVLSNGQKVSDDCSETTTETTTEIKDLAAAKADGAAIEIPSPKPLTEYQQFTQNLADICGEDMAIKSIAKKVGVNAGELWSAGYKQPDLEKFKKWWYANDWRGKKQQRPNLTNVKSLIKQATQIIPVDPIPAKPSQSTSVFPPGLKPYHLMEKEQENG